jgi:CBS domain-containing protein
LTKNPFVVYPDDDIYTVAILMTRHGISGIPVIKNKKLVGIVTKTDIVNVLANEKTAK